VVDLKIAEDDNANSLNMSEDPGQQYPPEYGLNEFTPPFALTLGIYIIWDSSYSNRMVMIGASLMDFYARIYTNPGIEINFEIIPESIATISSPVYTGENGWARSKLEFSPIYALDEITLIASCDWTADTVNLNLPLLDPRLELNTNPEILQVRQSGEYDTSYVSCRLSDGMNYYIDGGRIVFISLVAGEICGPSFDYTDDHGWAYTQYRIRYEDIPEGNDDPHLIETGVRAVLFGYPDVEEEIRILCVRP
jgi:hypothetical protein